MLKNVLPQRLIRMRVIRGLTQRALARLSGVGRTTIIRIESGQITDLKVKTLLRICLRLSISMDHILGLDDNPNIARKLIGASPVLIEAREVICEKCFHRFRRGMQHIPGSGECIMFADAAGRSREYLSATYGFSLEVIEAILGDEYGRRGGHRPRPAA